ncbi:MAG: T9SS type A sorting domain-containing protein [Cytophagales bacterium]|nr:T9SS type A sorting domain-containing protein [Cytophagales bacterium]
MNSFYRFPIFFILYIFSISSYGQTISTPVFTKSTYQKYEKVEARFSLSNTYSNPYDTAVIQVDAILTLPNSSTIVLPCFYYVPVSFVGTNATASSTGTWMWRYAGTTTGTYSVKIKAIPSGNPAATYTSSSANFSIVNGTLPGFIRVDASNKQFYRFENGTPYYPTGLNVAWNDGTLLSFYKTYLNNLGTKNVNWMRYWLTDFARQALEWSSGHWSGWYNGLGQYSQQAAAELDSVLTMCGEKGIYLQLTMQHHGQFSTTVNPEWSGNPYNSANSGGLFTDPCLFFTNAAAIRQAKKQYRYILARWGYSSQIFAWELFNEVNFASNGTACTVADISSWHKTMSDYIKGIDINKKLITTSAGGPGDPIMTAVDAGSPNLDIIQFHTYPGSPIEQPIYNSDKAAWAYTKSAFCGGFGASGTYPTVVATDNWGDHVRKPLWIGMMSKSPNQFWYWDEYIKGYNLYTVFKPLTTFLNGVDIVSETAGNTTNFSFANNPGTSSVLTIAPGNSNWSATNIPNPWTGTIQSDGSVTNISDLSSYLQGSWQGTRSREATFTVNFQSTGVAAVNFSGSSSAGSNSLQIYLDGSLQSTNAIASGAGGTYSVTGISPGSHTIRFLSNGQDWLQVNNFTFTNVPVSKLSAYGYLGTNKAYGYVNDNSYGAWANPASLSNITSAAINIGPLTPGNYQVDFFDPQAGTNFYSGGIYTTSISSNLITVTLPGFKKDIAFKVYPSIPLSINLTQFTAILLDNLTAELSWNIYPSEQVSKLEVEKSQDGTNFYFLGTVATSPQTNNYTYIDPKPNLGTTYYRLITYSNSGVKTYSQIATISRINHEEVSTYPNPAKTSINIKIPANLTSSGQILVYNNLGQLFLTSNVTVNDAGSIVNLNISGLPNAIYLLKIASPTGEAIVKSVFMKE